MQRLSERIPDRLQLIDWILWIYGIYAAGHNLVLTEASVSFWCLYCTVLGGCGSAVWCLLGGGGNESDVSAGWPVVGSSLHSGHGARRVCTSVLPSLSQLVMLWIWTDAVGWLK